MSEAAPDDPAHRRGRLRLRFGRREDPVRVAFDEAYYRETQVRQLTMDAFDHYRTVGWRNGLDPAPWFSTKDYLSLHPDVASAGMCPFEHYVLQGRAEHRALRAPDAKAPSAPSRHRGLRPRRTPEQLAAALVDPGFYLAMYPDVERSGYGLATTSWPTGGARVATRTRGSPPRPTCSPTLMFGTPA